MKKMFYNLEARSYQTYCIPLVSSTIILMREPWAVSTCILKFFFFNSQNDIPPDAQHRVYTRQETQLRGEYRQEGIYHVP